MPVDGGNRLVYVVPAKTLGVDVAASFDLEFKWSDNRQTDDVMKILFALNFTAKS